MEILLLTIGVALGFILAPMWARFRKEREASTFKPLGQRDEQGLLPRFRDVVSWLGARGERDLSLDCFGRIMNPCRDKQICWVCGRAKTAGHGHDPE
jgi:hypothetical protein